MPKERKGLAERLQFLNMQEGMGYMVYVDEGTLLGKMVLPIL